MKWLDHFGDGMRVMLIALVFSVVSCDSADDEAQAPASKGAKLSNRSESVQDSSRSEVNPAKLSERPEGKPDEQSAKEAFEMRLSEAQRDGLEDIREQARQWFAENPDVKRPVVPDEETLATLREQLRGLVATNPDNWSEYYQATVRDHLGPQYASAVAPQAGGLVGTNQAGDDVVSDSDTSDTGEGVSLNERYNIDPEEARRMRELLLKSKEGFPKATSRDRKYRVGQ